MKRLLIYISLALVASLSSCTSFLDVTPNKSGSSYIYHMDQLYGLTGNSTPYRTGYLWTDLIFRGDGIELHPYYVTATGRAGSEYEIWSWDDKYLETGGLTGTTWAPCYNAIYSYNTVLENLDKVTQTTPQVRKQVEGEALFGRAFFHFIVLVQYTLWDDEAPGIGYKDNTFPSGDIPRETVKYSLGRIMDDLNNAEKLLTEAGRTNFEIERNFRPTVPTVKALRARINLYRGKYSEALKDAEGALAGYSVLEKFADNSLYVLTESNINFLNSTNSAVAKVEKFRSPNALLGKGGEALWKHPEFYIPAYAGLYYANKSLPISQTYFNLFTDKVNDQRWNFFYNNNYILNTNLAQTMTLPGSSTPTLKCVKWEHQTKLPEACRHTYLRFNEMSGGSSKQFMIGPTTAEMYLIKAECLARAGKSSEAATALKTLRRTRFATQTSADAIGGSLQEVLDERAREMSELWRFFDIKRLNGADKANIKITRQVLTNTSDINSVTTVTINADDPRWAIPIDAQQKILMG